MSVMDAVSHIAVTDYVQPLKKKLPEKRPIAVFALYDPLRDGLRFPDNLTGFLLGDPWDGRRDLIKKHKPTPYIDAASAVVYDDRHLSEVRQRRSLHHTPIRYSDQPRDARAEYHRAYQQKKRDKEKAERLAAQALLPPKVYKTPEKERVYQRNYQTMVREKRKEILREQRREAAIVAAYNGSYHD